MADGPTLLKRLGFGGAFFKFSSRDVTENRADHISSFILAED